jgi:hypothetical protein
MALAVQSSDNKPQLTRIYDLLTVLDVAVEGYRRDVADGEAALVIAELSDRVGRDPRADRQGQIALASKIVHRSNCTKA